jgi:outer membrane protein
MIGTAVSALALALALPLHSSGAETLREALMKAYESNPTLAAARAGQRAVDEGVAIAKAGARPTANSQFSFTENFIRSANSFAAPLRQGVASGSVTVPIYSGGSVRNGIAAAKIRVTAGQADLRATESTIFAQVVASYMDVIRDGAIVDLNRANVGVLSVNLQASSDRFEIGDLTRTDVAQSEARLQLAISDLENARANLIGSKENYIALVGDVPGTLDAPPPLPNLPATADAAVEVALANNPDLIAAINQAEAAGFDVKAARATRKPQLEAFADGSYVNFLNSLGTGLTGANFFQEQSTASVGLRLNVPIYQGGRPSAQIRQAQARSGQAQENVILVERNVIAQTRAAYASWQASLTVIESTQRAVAANELSLEGVRAENSVGNRTVLEILNAEQELLNSQVQLVIARRNAYVAGFSLLAAMGLAEARDLGLDGGTLYDPNVNYTRVRGIINDYQTDPDPTAQAQRTVDTPAQSAPIEPLPEIIPAEKRTVEMPSSQ